VKKKVMEALDSRRGEFERLYLRQRLALRGVAEALGVSVSMLTLWMDENKIPRRNRAQAQHNRSKRLGKTEEVIRLRLAEHLTMEQIAERLSYSSKGTVHSILSYRGLDGPIETLPSYEIYLKDRSIGRYSRAKPTQAGPKDDGGDDGDSGPTRTR
jgi:transposase